MRNNLYPIYPNHKYALACSSSNEYVPYLATYLQSILDNAKDSKKYDIVVLETDISEENKSKILKMNTKSNVSIRFFNVDFLFENVDLHVQYDYFSEQCYFRLAVGKIFHKYNKVLFTDIDICLNKDISEIFEFNMHKLPLAACEEVLWNQDNRIGKFQSGVSVEDYIKNTVKCTDKYFNTGVMLVDIEKFNEVATFDDLLKIALDNKFINQEQDVLNQVFDNKIYKLSEKYNFEIFFKIYTDLAYSHYMSSLDDAKLYHYLTRLKVWFYPDMLKADIWWSYARKTPFYEEILARLIDFRISQKAPQTGGNVAQLRQEFVKTHFPNINNRFSANEYNTKLLYVLNHSMSFRFKKAWYGFKKAFSFGKRHQKYQAKYDTVKRLLKDARKFKKQMMKV